jgi:bifunctional enzyme CysN/CysC
MDLLARHKPDANDVNQTVEKPILRFLTCGSVDDGKSTLIGRLLYESNQIFDDTLESLESESKVHGTTGEEVDFALLVDGLQAEREQGITIDVAYRYFATPNRKFIVADTPGHEQYTRNMVTGASRSDAAIILVDARKGVLRQTRRHSCVVRMLGIKHVVVAINKMDLVDFSESRFRQIDSAYREFARELGIEGVVTIPLSALRGDNLCARSSAMPWYHGPTLLEHLETVDVAGPDNSLPMRMPVQWVCRPDHKFRGYAGTLTAGSVKVGDTVATMPSGRTSTVDRIVSYNGNLENAEAGDAVVITLADEVDISRGDVICAEANRPEVSDQFQANLVWMSAKPMLPGRPYLIQQGTQRTNAQISTIRHRIGMDTLEKMSARQLELNDVAVVNLSTAKPLVIAPYDEDAKLGSFILIDRITNETVGAGMIEYGLHRAQNIHWQSINVTKEQRANAKGQKPCCLWFTGLSGSGKSTVANALDLKLQERGTHTYILDGDNVRHGLNRDLGFTDVDRVENIRRVAEVGRLMTDAGLVTLVSFISPFRAERELARERFDEGEFLEIFVDTPIEICEQRDPKGLYVKARAGEIENFTGISSPYEAPQKPDIRLDGGHLPPDQLAEQIIKELIKRGYIAED